ncbi:MAG: hypothetical protein H0W18_04810, partial [Acidobacteria bacterium]|nr:hypothetical protein [Acidobacteriota bacterium]
MPFVRPAHAAVLLLAVVVALAVPMWYWEGGLIEIESTQFVRQYLDDRSAPQKVFDPHGNDLGTYQARELSYFVDYLDARIFEVLMLADRPVFVPASALLASALTILVTFVAMRRFPPAAKLPAALVLLVFLTNYVHLVTMGMLYRSAKPMLVPLLIGTLFYVLAILRGRRIPRAAKDGWRPTAALTVFVLFSVISLLDRQGFFYAVAGTIVLGIHGVLVGGRRDVLAGGVAAVCAMTLYNLMLAPFLVETINGYSPSFEYQRLPWRNIFNDPLIIQHAFELVVQSAAVLLGGPSVRVFGLVCAAALLWMLFSRRKGIAAAIIAVIAVQTALVALLIARHPPIYDWYDHRLWYYPLPFQALLAGLLIAAIGRVVPTWSTARTVVLSVVLVAMAIGNVVHWKDYRRAQLRSHWFPSVYTQNAALKSSFADGRPRPSLSPEFFAFFEFWRMRSPALRERAERA